MSEPNRKLATIVFTDIVGFIPTLLKPPKIHYFIFVSLTLEFGYTLWIHLVSNNLQNTRCIMRKTPHIIRTRKPYQTFLFRCIIPKDLISVFRQVEFRVSLGNSMYSHSKIISTNLYNICQFIFREVREGYMKDITLVDVKNILRIEVRKSLMHIHHYEYGTNVYDDKKLNKSISRIDDNEEKLRDRLEKDYRGTVELIEQEIDKILITQNLEPNKKNVEYKGLVRRWIDLKLIRQNWKRDLLGESGKTDNDFRNELEDKWKLGLWENPNEVRDLLQSVDDGGTPSVITNNLRKISEKLDVKISKSDKPIDVINNIRLEKRKRDA